MRCPYLAKQMGPDSQLSGTAMGVTIQQFTALAISHRPATLGLWTSENCAVSSCPIPKERTHKVKNWFLPRPQERTCQQCVYVPFLFNSNVLLGTLCSKVFQVQLHFYDLL